MPEVQTILNRSRVSKVPTHLPPSTSTSAAFPLSSIWTGKLEPGHQLVVPPPLPSTHPGRPSLPAGDPQRAAPRPPRAPDICSQCENQEAHICLHSYAPSDLSGGSVGSQRHHSEGPSTTSAAPRLPPAVTQQPWAAGFRPVTLARRSPPPLQPQRRSSHTTPAA